MAMSAFLQVWCRWWPSILRANVGNKFKLHFSCINIEWHPPNRHPPVQTTHPPHHVQKRISTIQEIHHTRLPPHLEWNRTLTTPDLHHTGHPQHQKFITSDIHHALCVKKGLVIKASSCFFLWGPSSFHIYICRRAGEYGKQICSFISQDRSPH